MDTLQLLTRTLRPHCAFRALTLVLPHLLPPGSFAILSMAAPLPPPQIIDASENADSLVFVVTLKRGQIQQFEDIFLQFQPLIIIIFFFFILRKVKVTLVLLSTGWNETSLQSV